MLIYDLISIVDPEERENLKKGFDILMKDIITPPIPLFPFLCTVMK